MGIEPGGGDGGRVGPGQVLLARRHHGGIRSAAHVVCRVWRPPNSALRRNTTQHCQPPLLPVHDLVSPTKRIRTSPFACPRNRPTGLLITVFRTNASNQSVFRAQRRALDPGSEPCGGPFGGKPRRIASPWPGCRAKRELTECRQLLACSSSYRGSSLRKVG